MYSHLSHGRLEWVSESLGQKATKAELRQGFMQQGSTGAPGVETARADPWPSTGLRNGSVRGLEAVPAKSRSGVKAGHPEWHECPKQEDTLTPTHAPHEAT